jgi:uncharacterized protein YegL
MRWLRTICMLFGTALAVGSCADDQTSSTSTTGSGVGLGQAGGPGAAGGAAAGVGAVGGPGGTGSVPGGIGSTPGGPGGPGVVPGGMIPCSTKTINAYGLVPDMLIVLDKSTSMLQARWEPSKQAVKTITTEFENLISFGLEYFPAGDGGLGNIGGIGGIIGGLLGGGGMAGGPPPAMCGGMEKLDVPLMLKNAMPIAQSMDSTMPNGFTPTGPALDAALKILGNRMQGIDEVVKPAYVLLVTDGDPRCNLAEDPAQQDAARAAVRALKAASIPTYVFGYQIDGAFRGLMDELAMLGGTMHYYPVESGDQIVTAFRDVTKDVIKCSFSLDTVPPDPKKVRVQIDGKSIPLNAADGWVIEGKNVTLQGGSCAMLKDGAGHTLAAQVECTEVILN